MKMNAEKKINEVSETSSKIDANDKDLNFSDAGKKVIAKRQSVQIDQIERMILDQEMFFRPYTHNMNKNSSEKDGLQLLLAASQSNATTLKEMLDKLILLHYTYHPVTFDSSLQLILLSKLSNKLSINIGRFQ